MIISKFIISDCCWMGWNHYFLTYYLNTLVYFICFIWRSTIFFSQVCDLFLCVLSTLALLGLLNIILTCFYYYYYYYFSFGIFSIGFLVLDQVIVVLVDHICLFNLKIFTDTLKSIFNFTSLRVSSYGT